MCVCVCDLHWNMSVKLSLSVVSDSLRPHGLQHTRTPCSTPTPRVYSNSCPLSRWCHPAISSSVVPFSSCLHLSKWGSFQMSQFFASGGQSIGVSVSTSVLPVEIVTIWISDIRRSVSKEELRTKWHIQWRQLHEKIHVKLRWHWYYSCVTGIRLIWYVSLERPGGNPASSWSPLHNTSYLHLGRTLAQPVTSYWAMCLPTHLLQM